MSARSDAEKADGTRRTLPTRSAIRARPRGVRVEAILPGQNLKPFLDCVDEIYRGDSHYVRPLDQDLKDRFDPKKNPFFHHGEAIAFVAERGGRIVGRISASIDKSHLEKFDDSTGFFGFLDTVDDVEVVRALLEAAEGWLRDRGMKRALGPFSLNINEETGLLVEGFDTPAYLMMPHSRPYQAGLVEQAGYTKAMDFFAWSYEVGKLNARTKKAHADILALPEIQSRPLDMKRLGEDIRTCVDIFNDAWSENWGAVPITEAEGEKMAQDFKLILMPEITRIVTIDGEPAAFAIAVPNLNELIGDLDGKLFPFGILKLLYRLKIDKPKTGRLMLLGIRKKFQKHRKYAALSHFMYAEMDAAGAKLGMTGGELSWTLEDNAAINVAIKSLGAKAYKRYRVWDKPL